VADKSNLWDALNEVRTRISDWPRELESFWESLFLVAQKQEISYSYREFGSERLKLPF
jgi:hypothetical protein